MTANDPCQDEVPDYQRHQFGGNFGGPILENQTHVFGAVERTDETDFYTVNTLGVYPEYEGTFTRDSFRNMYVVRATSCRGLSLEQLNDLRAGVGGGPIKDFRCPNLTSVDLRTSKFFDVGGPSARLEIMA